MKIAYFVDRFPLISETFVLAQITGMIDRGHDVQIFANRKVKTDVVHPAVEKYDLAGKTVFLPRLPRSPVSRMVPAMRAAFRALRQGCLRHVLRTLNVRRFGRDALNFRLLLEAAPFFGSPKYDILHCQFGHLGVSIAKVKSCGALSGALVTSFRGTDAMKIATTYPAMFTGLFATGNRFLCVSDTVMQRLVSLGCPAGKIEILRSGIDLQRFRFRKHGDIHKPVRVVSVGRLAPRKGLDFGIEAVSLVRAAGHDIEYRLLGSGPSRDYLREKAEALGIADHVIFEGPADSDRVIAVMSQADILITPSITGRHGEQEGLPNAPKEAMAIGVPVIATRTGGIPELISHGKTGFLVAEKSAQAIADYLCSLIDTWADLGNLVAAARRRIEQEFEIEKLNDQLQGVYQSLVSEECLPKH